MIKIDKNLFIEESTGALNEILSQIEGAPVLNLEDLKSDETAFIIVDMINGFAREGALASPRVETLIPEIVRLSEKCDVLGIQKIAFADNHTDQSPEFSSYPPHCLTDTPESEVVDEIKAVGNYLLIPKNSTNGFHEAAYRAWMEQHSQVKNFIIVGDCTNLCVLQFALTLKTYFNARNEKSRLIVPINAVETYHLGAHHGDLMNVFALFNLMGNGIEVVAAIH